MSRRHKKHEEHEEHHGGAWKIAYADFITTMMAFFLLLWLLNAASEEQKQGISDYFQGIASVFEDAKLSSQSFNAVPKPVEQSATGPLDAPADFDSEGKLSHAEAMKHGGGNAVDQDGTGGNSFTGNVASRSNKHHEAQRFRDIASELEAAVQKDAGTKDMSDQLLLDNRDEGLRIQIVDKTNRQLFPGGSSEMKEETKNILEKVAKVLRKFPHKISIAGHTDAKPFGNNKTYSNWELSFDRANASRRVLEASGIHSDRIVSVIGKEAKEPLIKEDPENPKNRRITITLHRQNGKVE